ncbi:MAG: DNA cytosine methyltransferase [Magnetococcales bacterium]|nr:DNA cytosine methyltransferase [Magnetococcales bacterium]
MARLGLGKAWRPLLVNEWDEKKISCYQGWFGQEPTLAAGDVAALTPARLPGRADLAWASFPCQDLSLAGAGAGLRGARSGTFWPFWALMRGLRREGRAPRLIVLENVRGAITSHGGEDLAAIVRAVGKAGYVVGALVIDAVHFLPQSRPRLFIVAVDRAIPLPPALRSDAPQAPWHPASLERVLARLTAAEREAWVWWRLPSPPPRPGQLLDLLEAHPQETPWHGPEETARLLALMTPVQRAKVAAMQAAGERQAGGLFKRTRKEADGGRRQRAEVRFDGVAGCLRTPAGGSSRQTVVLVEGGEVRSRLLSPREAARLMGLPEAYPLPASRSDAYHLTGDGVAVPVVRFLASHLLEPLLET